MIEIINIEEALKLENVIFIDTRTPKEFEQDCLPNAINLPILTNEERAIVGTLYKQVSKEKAIEQGMEYFSPKLPDFLSEIKKHQDKNIIVYCWRGGMRSKTVVALFEALGYRIKQMKGGYKSYRKYVIDQIAEFKLKPKLVVLSGLTCTGKTDLLKLLPHSLDLEGLAQHRNSLYGAIGLIPNSQKKFENLMLQKLNELNKEKYIFIEGESRRIGDVEIPPFLWKAMRNDIHVLIKRKIENRAKACAEEYFSTEENVKKIKEITLSLWKVIGRKRKLEAAEYINQGNYQEAAKILLEEYYDPLYGNTLKQFNYELKVDSDDVKKAVKLLSDRFQ